MRITTYILLLSVTMFATNAFALTCDGHMVNGYNSTDYGYKRFQSMTVTFKGCSSFIPKSLCNSVYLNGEKKTAYWADSGFIFYNPHGKFTPQTGHLQFKMREARLNANANEDERWFNGICR